MKQLNTVAIEDFLEKARIAIRSNQKTLTLTIKETTELQNSLSVLMTRLVAKYEQEPKSPEKIEIKMDGGKF
jgi:hypothetical protein